MSIRQYLDRVNETEAAEVRKAPKLIHYTIKPIKDIVEHRVALALSESRYRAHKEVKLIAAKVKAVKMVEDQMSTLSFTKAEREEVLVLARKKALKSYLISQYSESSFLPYESPSFFSKLKQAVKRLWLAAFPQ